MRTIVFRVDSSTQIGSGHLMRSLTLANRLKEKVKIVFISRDLIGNLHDLIGKNNFQYFALPRMNVDESLVGYEKWLTVKQIADADQTQKLIRSLGKVDCLIIDSYAIDVTWEKIIRPYVNKIMVIDDLANRKHDCDILLDQNFYINLDSRYDGLVPSGCKMLLGSQYVLLREEFYEARKNMRTRNGIIKNILVFFGGSDPTNETGKALKAIVELNRPDIIVNVVVGGSNPHKKEIEDFCQNHLNMRYHCQVDCIAKLMAEADLAIGAGGTTTWERCFLGLPAIVIAVAENQVTICEDCARAGYIYYLGKNIDIDEKKIYTTLTKLIKEKRQGLRQITLMEEIKSDWISAIFASSDFK